jgi:hypothetical protein
MVWGGWLSFVGASTDKTTMPDISRNSLARVAEAFERPVMMMVSPQLFLGIQDIIAGLGQQEVNLDDDFNVVVIDDDDNEDDNSNDSGIGSMDPLEKDNNDDNDAAPEPDHASANEDPEWERQDRVRELFLNQEDKDPSRAEEAQKDCEAEDVDR